MYYYKFFKNIGGHYIHLVCQGKCDSISEFASGGVISCPPSELLTALEYIYSSGGMYSPKKGKVYKSPEGAYKFLTQK